MEIQSTLYRVEVEPTLKYSLDRALGRMWLEESEVDMQVDFPVELLELDRDLVTDSVVDVDDTSKL